MWKAPDLGTGTKFNGVKIPQRISTLKMEERGERGIRGVLAAAAMKCSTTQLNLVIMERRN